MYGTSRWRAQRAEPAGLFLFLFTNPPFRGGKSAGGCPIKGLAAQLHGTHVPRRLRAMDL